MSEWQVRPEAVEQAVAWLRENDARFTEDALVNALREQGYAEAEIANALRARRAEQPAQPAGPDLRARAAVILIVAFLGTWAALSFLLVSRDTGHWQIGQIASLILGAVLGLIGILSLIGIFASKRLRQGAEGALVAVLAIPFVFLLITAGLCVFTTGGMLTG